MKHDVFEIVEKTIYIGSRPRILYAVRNKHSGSYYGDWHAGRQYANDRLDQAIKGHEAMMQYAESDGFLHGI